MSFINIKVQPGSVSPPRSGADRVSEMVLVGVCARVFITDLRGAKLELRVTTYTTLHGTDL